MITRRLLVQAALAGGAAALAGCSGPEPTSSDGPLDQSRRYLTAAKKAGGDVTLTELPGVGHFELIDPKHQAWITCRKETLRLLG
jgi:hypothetical protein